MKRIGWLIFTMIIALNGSAQVSKGLFLLEGGIQLAGNVSVPYMATTGISFGSDNFYLKDVDGNISKELGGSYWRYSVSPKVGYALSHNFVVGVDLQYHRKMDRSKNEDHMSRTNRSMLYGLFVRQYVGKGMFQPFVEAGTGIGRYKSMNDEYTLTGYLFTETERRDLFYLCGATGVSYAPCSLLRVNLLAKAQLSTEKPIETEVYHYSLTKTETLSATMILSFSYFLFMPPNKSKLNSM